MLATQNPIEQEGTYPLPEAQIDRFMLKVKVGYPTRDEEKEILRRAGLSDAARAHAGGSARGGARRRARRWPRSTSTTRSRTTSSTWCRRRASRSEFGLDLAHLIAFGACRARRSSCAGGARPTRCLDGRAYVTPDDVKAIALDVLRHRILVTYEAEAEEHRPARRSARRKILEQVRGPVRSMETARAPPARSAASRSAARHLVEDVFAGQYESRVQGARHGVRRGAPVRARRRRARHRLERHRAHSARRSSSASSRSASSRSCCWSTSSGRSTSARGAREQARAGRRAVRRCWRSPALKNRPRRPAALLRPARALRARRAGAAATCCAWCASSSRTRSRARGTDVGRRARLREPRRCAGARWSSCSPTS